jgi:DNA-binding GntR family transcriptional regulator
VRLEQRIRRQPNLASQVYAALCEDITTGVLARGERVVVDRLADHLGVSPTPVREAVACLVKDGLICEAPDGKLQVVPLTRDYVVEIFLVRGALEGLAAELAAPRIDAADLGRLREALQETGDALASGDYAAYVATDALLHGAVRAAAGNRALARELQALEAHVAYIRGYAQRHHGEHMARSHAEHTRVVDALAGRDAPGARAAMERHIRRSGERIARLIEFEEGQD